MASNKYRNINGDACYVFAWIGGGGNHVYANSKKSAIARAKAFGASLRDRDGVAYSYEDRQRFAKTETLVPDERSFRSVTFEQFLEFDRGLAMLAW